MMHKLLWNPHLLRSSRKRSKNQPKKDSTDKILSSNKDDEKKGNILPKREKSPPPERVQNNTDKKENGKILSKQQKSPSPAPAKKRTDTKETHPKPVKKTAKSAPAKKPVKDTMPSWDVTYAPTVVELPPPALGAPSPLGGPPAAVEEDKRSCRLLGFTPTVQTCGFMALSLIIAGLLTTFWTTKSEGALAFWVGFVCGCILVLIGGKAFFNLTDDDIVLLIGLTVGLLVGIASLYFIWIAHTLSTLMVVGLVIYSAVRFGPYLIRQFGNHWWLWCLSFLLILPIIIFGWNLYRVLAHFVKTALGALLITVGVEYFLNAYTTLLNPKFHILRLVDGSRLDCHGGTCVGEMSFWIIVTLIGSFVHNFGISEFHSFKRKSRSRSPSEAESEQKLFSPSTEKDPMNYSNQRSYNSTGQTSNRSPFGKEIAGGNGDHLYSSAYKSINLQK
uniref:DUF4203 domain-containing protein n=1 Tax=Amorphochlora amoebiformis TaxID=1561963 RepID=A0A7S0DHX9_9EUKA|mmetsp:Transcript_26712/g.42384  ORF Transcript_26712/g.42384 Transcript_26712/m.42384 type:complete len:446 (+) Transcript_26712:435-1772(+)